MASPKVIQFATLTVRATATYSSFRVCVARPLGGISTARWFSVDHALRAPTSKHAATSTSAASTATMTPTAHPDIKLLTLPVAPELLQRPGMASRSQFSDEILNGLRAGLSKFRRKYFGSTSRHQQLMADLRVGQAPKALLVGCSDSRADPALITSARPGDLFVVRNVANLVPPYLMTATGVHGVSAAVEFAVKYLNVQHIIVMGHSQCGGVRALMSEASSGEFIDNWMATASKTRDAVKHNFPKSSLDEQCHACEQMSVVNSLQNLLSFPWVKDRAEKGSLLLHGWYFHLESGQLMTLEPSRGVFVPFESLKSPLASDVSDAEDNGDGKADDDNSNSSVLNEKK